MEGSKKRGAETENVAKDIGLSFESHRYDRPGATGRFNASHAEAQLMCIFVRNYIFRNIADGHKSDVDDFLQLFMLQERNRQAEIVVSQTPCRSCRALRDCIRDRLRINFSFRVFGVRQVSFRSLESRFGCPACYTVQSIRV